MEYSGKDDGSITTWNIFQTDQRFNNKNEIKFKKGWRKLWIKQVWSL